MPGYGGFEAKLVVGNLWPAELAKERLGVDLSTCQTTSVKIGGSWHTGRVEDQMCKKGVVHVKLALV